MDAHRGHLFELLDNGELDLSNLAMFDFSSLRNGNEENILMVAARTNQVEIVNQYAKELNLEEIDVDGWTALLNASYVGNSEIVKILLDSGAAVDGADAMGWTPLMWAVYKNHIDCVELLIKNKAHINLIDEEDGLTPLIIASGRGFTEIVELLLTSGAEVNACDKFGSTALIWAARKGYRGIAEMLLNKGAELDAVGMYGATALILAARANYIETVDLLLSRDPNVNATDQNGLSSLGIAAREGYSEIASLLIDHDAYVNAVDRFGHSILASAVRSGKANIVKMILDKHADVNVKDSENRTALHLAVDKSFVDIVLVLLEKKPNLELKNKDGDTPLLRAVKNRHLALCQLLVNAGAKVSTSDPSGDNALHVALRSRSRRLTQCLLANPSDSRLLYRPNRLGQTPYAIDQQCTQPIIPLIFGPLDATTQLDAMLGYDVYSNVLADILCEPNLELPVTIGLYAKWGSGKSLLLAKMKDSMRSFSRTWLECVHLSWSWPFVSLLVVLCTLLTLFGITIVSVLQNIHYISAVGFCGLLLSMAWVFSYGLIYFGGEIKGWDRTTEMAHMLAKISAHLRILFSVVLLHAPILREKDLISSPVSFLFANYHRLSSIGGEQALAKIVLNLFEATENHYGTLAVRLFCALRTSYARGPDSKLRRVCAIPVILLLIIFSMSLMMTMIMLSIWLYDGMNFESKSLIGTLSFLIITVTLSLYPLRLILVHSFVNVPKRRINSAAQKISKLRFEGFMQKLQSEVDLLAAMIRSMDAFTASQTRLVVVVDGLDNCEQERMVQTLDALQLLFTSRSNRPFIVTIAVDPHIIISAVNHSMHSALMGTELTGHDYLKNIITMPFYLHNSAVRQLQSNLKSKRESLAEWKERFKRQDTFHGSYMSLRDVPETRQQSRKRTIVLGTRGIGHSLMADDYFSNMNPRAMKRIVNALTLTGRLMRAFEIDFSWVTLGYWVSLIEQWPSRMCWLIDQALDIPQDSYPLAQVLFVDVQSIIVFQLYNQLKQYIPKKDPLIDLDRNPDNFESFLEQASSPGPDQLTVGHVRRFVPCTSNLDPYLRKLIRECRMDMKKSAKIIHAQSALSKLTAMPVAGPGQYIFKDVTVWETLEIPLVEMSVDEVIRLVKKLDLRGEQMEAIISKIRAANLNGLVLYACDLDDVQHALKLNLGDWTLLRLMIETLRSWEPTAIQPETPPQSFNADPIRAMPSLISLASCYEWKRRLTAQTEVESDHQWLLESLSGMDLADPEGDAMATSAVPSADMDAASDKDSTESMRGSRENLLDEESYESTDHFQSLNRSEVVGRMRMNSIRSDVSNRSSSMHRIIPAPSTSHLDDSTDSEAQQTVREQSIQPRLSLRDIFKKNSQGD